VGEADRLLRKAGVPFRVPGITVMRVMRRRLSQTTYPLSHTVGGDRFRLIGLDMAYMLVQFAAIVLLTLGVYAFRSCGWERGRRLRCSCEHSSRIGSIPGLFRWAAVDTFARLFI